jgi:hypothetical protein
MEVPMLKATQTFANQSPVINLRHGRWLLGVLAMLIGVVGKESLLGLILGQTRQEISSLVRAGENGDAGAPKAWFLNN